MLRPRRSVREGLTGKSSSLNSLQTLISLRRSVSYVSIRKSYRMILAPRITYELGPAARSKAPHEAHFSTRRPPDQSKTAQTGTLGNWPGDLVYIGTDRLRRRATKALSRVAVIMNTPLYSDERSSPERLVVARSVASLPPLLPARSHPALGSFGR